MRCKSKEAAKEQLNIQVRDSGKGPGIKLGDVIIAMVFKGMKQGRHTEWRDQHQSLNLGAPAPGGQEDGEESTREASSSI